VQGSNFEGPQLKFQNFSSLHFHNRLQNCKYAVEEQHFLRNYKHEVADCWKKLWLQNAHMQLLSNILLKAVVKS
jgi:hypothetical protein